MRNMSGLVLGGVMTILGGVVTGCGSQAPTSTPQSRVSNTIITVVTQRNMTSWNVQVNPNPLTIRAFHVGPAATNPTLAVYTKTRTKNQWVRILLSSSNATVKGNDALTTTWPKNAPQFYGDIKLSLSWTEGNHRYTGNEVFSVKPF